MFLCLCVFVICVFCVLLLLFLHCPPIVSPCPYCVPLDELCIAFACQRAALVWHIGPPPLKWPMTHGHAEESACRPLSSTRTSGGGLSGPPRPSPYGNALFTQTQQSQSASQLFVRPIIFTCLEAFPAQGLSLHTYCPAGKTPERNQGDAHH